jgi:hypothetical protein
MNSASGPVVKDEFHKKQDMRNPEQMIKLDAAFAIV